MSDRQSSALDTVATVLFIRTETTQFSSEPRSGHYGDTSFKKANVVEAPSYTLHS